MVCPCLAVYGDLLNWAKIAVVLSSNLFFVASCTGISILAVDPLKHAGGQYMSMGAAPDLRMMVIASIPDPDKPGSRKLTHVILASLPKFQHVQPDHTFVIPPGEGKIEDSLADMFTSYRVKSLGEGRVEVETTFDHDVPPFGLTIIARYEATDRKITPIYTNASSPGVPLFFGFVGALILAIIGAVMKWVLRRKA